MIMCHACVIWAKMASQKMALAARYIEEAKELERLIEVECTDKKTGKRTSELCK